MIKDYYIDLVNWILNLTVTSTAYCLPTNWCNVMLCCIITMLPTTTEEV